jgi:hypothetical protein
VLSLVAFYADCLHEVLRVESGYRITLTYNLSAPGMPDLRAGVRDLFRVSVVIATEIRNR